MKVYTFHIKLGLTSYVFPLLCNLWNLCSALSLPDTVLCYVSWSLGLLIHILIVSRAPKGNFYAILEGCFLAPPTSMGPCAPNPAMLVDLNSDVSSAQRLLFSAWALYPCAEMNVRLASCASLFWRAISLPSLLSSACNCCFTQFA